jgi:hypothetical protein
LFLAFFLYAPFACHRFSWAFASASIALSTLTPNWQTLSVADTSITIYVPQPSNIASYLSAKLTSHYIISVDNLGYSAKLIFAEPAGLLIFFNLCLLQNLPGCIFAYTSNISQRNPYGFIIWNINTNYTRHISSF